jgi:hypothetical protein
MDSTSVLDLVTRVRTTFFNYPSEKLEHCCAMLHEHYRSISMCDGGNKYPDPHCGIRRRVARGLDPVNYSVHIDDGYGGQRGGLGSSPVLILKEIESLFPKLLKFVRTGALCFGTEEVRIIYLFFNSVMR